MRLPKKIIITIIIILINLLSLPHGSPAVQKGDYGLFKKQLDDYIIRLMRKKDLRGLSIALVDDQMTVFSEGYGWADEKKKVRAAPDTAYQIGALSKIFTAMAVMKLVEKGKINLDAPISRYIPEFSIKSRFSKAKPVTARTLLSQHSGIPSELFKGMYTKTRPVSFNEYINSALAFLKDDYVCAPPDTVYANCNLGFVLLGHLLQRITREHFASFTDRELFQAMEMPNSSFSVDRVPATMTKGFVNDRETPLFKVNNLPAGSAHSSAEDMANLIKTIFAGGRYENRTILKQQTLKTMMTQQNTHALFDCDFKIGLGWQLDGYDLTYDERLQYEGLVAWHGGDTIANNATLIMLPAEKLGVVVLCNTAKGLRESGNVALKCLNLALEVKKGKHPPLQKEPVLPVVRLSPERIKQIKGYYSSEYLGFLSIREEEEGLILNGMDYDITLLPHADGNFSVRFYLFGFIPINIDILNSVRFKIETVQDRTAIVLHRNGKRYLGGIKIDRPALAPIWKSRLGTYSIIAQGDDAAMFKNLRLVMREGFLIFMAEYVYIKNALVMLPLEPVSDNECVVMGLGRNMGQTARFSNVNGESRFSFSGLVLKRK